MVIGILLLTLLAYLLYRHKFWRQAVLVTLFVLALSWFVDGFTSSTFYASYIDPLENMQDEIEPLDFIASTRPAVKDDHIVIVNIGIGGRRQLADMIKAIDKMNPRVIGLDVIFNCEGGRRDSINCPQLLDTLGNRLLSNAIREAGNVVLGSKLMWSTSLAKIDSDQVDSLELSDSPFNDYSQHGFTTLPTNATFAEDVMVCRSMYPSRTVKGKRELAWSVRVAMLYDSAKANKFLNRDNDEELINFRGNIYYPKALNKEISPEELDPTQTLAMFPVIDVDDVQNGTVQPEYIKDKIVIMGYVGKYIGDPSALADKFFTPLNRKISGRSNPDTFGPVIHANIVAEILNEDYIDEQPQFDALVINFGFVCFMSQCCSSFVKNGKSGLT